jgi:hypothetical protein
VWISEVGSNTSLSLASQQRLMELRSLWSLWRPGWLRENEALGGLRQPSEARLEAHFWKSRFTVSLFPEN